MLIAIAVEQVIRLANFKHVWTAIHQYSNASLSSVYLMDKAIRTTIFLIFFFNFPVC